MEINANLNNPYTGSASRQSDALIATKNQSANSADKAEIKTPSFREIASKYDVTNISPKEIDELGFQLRQSGQADDGDILMLETHGATFKEHIGHLSGYTYSETSTNSPVNLLLTQKDQLEIARKNGDPTESRERGIEFLEEIQSQRIASKNNLTSDMMIGLVSAQEVK